MHITAIILRATPGQRNTWLLSGLSDKLGRTTFSTIAHKSTGFGPFSLVEAVIDQAYGRSISREIEVLDTFITIRDAPGAAKSAFLIREILEQCVPMHAIIEDLWNLVLSLFGALHTFHDWKAAPLLLALTLYEHEGISPQTLTEQPLLSHSAKEIANLLLTSDIATWKKTEIPDELLIAALETIGVKEAENLAKGGT